MLKWDFPKHGSNNDMGTRVKLYDKLAIIFEKSKTRTKQKLEGEREWY